MKWGPTRKWKYFLERVRDEISFQSIDALREQIAHDVKKARRYFHLLKAAQMTIYGFIANCRLKIDIPAMPSPYVSQIKSAQRRTLIAGGAGMDARCIRVMLYALVLAHIMRDWG